MNINSGYRCIKYNNSHKVRGSKNSNHLEGAAIDFSLKGVTDNMDEIRLGKFRNNIVNKWLEIVHSKGDLAKGIKYFAQVEIQETYIHLALNVNSDKNKDRVGLYGSARNTKNTNFKRYM